MEGLVVVGVIIIGLVIGAFLWQLARSIYYWTAAKIYGWSEDEKFERETAWLDREAARAERQAKKNEALARNSERKRMGAYLCAFAIGALCWELGLPWWQVALGAGIQDVELQAEGRTLQAAA